MNSCTSAWSRIVTYQLTFCVSIFPAMFFFCYCWLVGWFDLFCCCCFCCLLILECLFRSNPHTVKTETSLCFLSLIFSYYLKSLMEGKIRNYSIFFPHSMISSIKQPQLTSPLEVPVLLWLHSGIDGPWVYFSILNCNYGQLAKQLLLFQHCVNQKEGLGGPPRSLSFL